MNNKNLSKKTTKNKWFDFEQSQKLLIKQDGYYLFEKYIQDLEKE